MKNITTIKIHKKTKERLDRLKEHPRESYEEVLRKVLFIMNLSKKNPEKAQLAFKKIDRAINRKQKYTKVDLEDTEEDQEDIKVEEDNSEKETEN